MGTQTWEFDFFLCKYDYRITFLQFRPWVDGCSWLVVCDQQKRAVYTERAPKTLLGSRSVHGVNWLEKPFEHFFTQDVSRHERAK